MQFETQMFHKFRISVFVQITSMKVSVIVKITAYNKHKKEIYVKYTAENRIGSEKSEHLFHLSLWNLLHLFGFLAKEKKKIHKSNKGEQAAVTGRDSLLFCFLYEQQFFCLPC